MKNSARTYIFIIYFSFNEIDRTVAIFVHTASMNYVVQIEYDSVIVIKSEIN